MTSRENLQSKVKKLHALAVELLSCCYMPADQTVQCLDCMQCWWGRAEDLEENWHAEGCRVFAAGVYLGVYRDVRKSPAPGAVERWYEPHTKLAVQLDAEVELARKIIQGQLAALIQGKQDGKDGP